MEIECTPFYTWWVFFTYFGDINHLGHVVVAQAKQEVRLKVGCWEKWRRDQEMVLA
jgi:hypothetical protein